MADSLQDKLDKLKGPFLTEERTGYGDGTVIGGLAPYVRRWVGEAAGLAPDEDTSAMLGALADAFDRYGEATPSGRAEMIRAAWDVLGRAGADLSGSRPAPDTGVEPPARPDAKPDRSAKPKRAARGPRTDAQTPIQYLKGVGPARAKALGVLGLSRVGDLLYHFPRAYEDRRDIRRIADLRPDEQVTIQGEVVAVGAKTTRSRLHILDAVVDDGSGVIHAVWFNQPFREGQVSAGQRIVLTGRARMYKGELQISPLDFQILDDGEGDELHADRIVPIYPLTRSITQRMLRRMVRTALDACAGGLDDPMPEYLIKTHSLMGLREALERIHFPDELPDRDEARRRLVLEEFILFQLALRMRKSRHKAEEVGVAHRSEGRLLSRLLETLPFELTEGQARAVEDVRADMESPEAMSRLVQGDVGSGKTIVAMAAAALAAEAGHQTAVMAPTEILAEQHFITLQRWLGPLGVSVELLTGSLSAAQRADALSALSDGSADVVVGTHALIEEAVSFRRLGLVVVDEQHRFGVEQRGALFTKGAAEGAAEGAGEGPVEKKDSGAKGTARPDLLVMTATPIPRTLALTLYGDLAVSSIQELPPGRRPVQTYAFPQGSRSDVYAFVASELAKGRQAYVVLPLIEESEAVEARAATTVADYLSKGPLSDFRVALLHGRVPAAEKDAVMRDFRDGRVDALVSTTVVEVGVDVPNATVMVVENAERFGLAQLHQLRGRVGRSEQQSYCFLLGDAVTEEASRRLSVMAATTDGFEIAEEDLSIRGPGHFLGTRQHGMPELAIGDLSRDLDLLTTARDEADALLSSDAGLGRHPTLRNAVMSRFGETFGLVG